MGSNEGDPERGPDGDLRNGLLEQETKLVTNQSPQSQRSASSNKQPPQHPPLTGKRTVSLPKDESMSIGSGAGVDSSAGNISGGAAGGAGHAARQRHRFMRARSGSFVSRSEFVAESLTAFTIQVLVPVLICGLGNLGAGQLLDVIQHWPVFTTITELYILVPSLMGLKGNLEMTMAARLSTAANLGLVDKMSEMAYMARGNLALVQCQATVVGFLASMMAVTVDTVRSGNVRWLNAALLCSSSIVTANLASIILSTVMIIVVVVCRKRSINPDNVATPIASSLGDITTVAILGVVASFLFAHINPNEGFGDEYAVYRWIPLGLAAIFLLVVPLSVRHAMQNRHTAGVVYSGWGPIILAMLLSSVSGVILDHAIIRFENIAPFQPVINGVGGNLLAIQASRMSTFLHQNSVLGTLPNADPRVWVGPVSTFASKKNPNSSPARILLILAVPLQIIYFAIIVVLKGEPTTVPFALMYLLACFVQVALLLHMTRLLVYWLWRWGSDPDNSAIPLLTATGDLLGTALLTGGFILLVNIGQPVM